MAIWFNSTSNFLQHENLVTILENDTDGKFSCWLLLEAENLTEKQKNRIIGNLIEKDTKNQYLPFVPYILDISQDEWKNMKNNHKMMMCDAEELLIIDR